MRDIYLIDFENVASEGLSGITYLSPEDQVIIFYSANSNRLSMKMHILIGKSTCKLSYFEVSVGGKNALDHQISTWLGYLIGTGAAERSYYIVSRDMGYRHVANFWAVNDGKPRVKCVETIRAAVRLERIRQEKEAQGPSEEQAEQMEQAIAPQPDPIVPVPVQAPAALLAVTEPVLQLKAAEQAGETEAAPLESLEEPEPGAKKNGRTRFRRNRRNGHGSYHFEREPKEHSPEAPKGSENPEAKHEPKAEAPKVEAKPEVKVEPPKAEAPKGSEKPEIKVEAPKPEVKTPEKKQAQSERYSTSFWQKPRPEPKPVVIPGLQTEVKSEPKAENKAERSQPKPENHVEAKPQNKPENKVEAKPQNKPENKIEAKPQNQPENKVEAKPQNKPENKVEAKPQNKPENKVEAKPEAKEQPEAKTEPKPEPKKKLEGRGQRKPKAEKREKPQKEAKAERVDLEQLPKLIAPYPQLQESALRELIGANKRQVLCNTLRKQLGQEKGLALYNELKKTIWK